MIRDLSGTRELDRRAMSAVAGLGSIANVNVSVNQNLSQIQTVNVAALNNIGVIGAGFVPVNLNVSPSLWAANYANV